MCCLEMLAEGEREGERLVNVAVLTLDVFLCVCVGGVRVRGAIHVCVCM